MSDLTSSRAYNTRGTNLKTALERLTYRQIEDAVMDAP